MAARAGLREAYPAVVELLGKAASLQLRNMTSLGSNLLQPTRRNYFHGGAPYARNKRMPGSGCAAYRDWTVSMPSLAAATPASPFLPAIGRWLSLPSTQWWMCSARPVRSGLRPADVKSSSCR